MHQTLALLATGIVLADPPAWPRAEMPPTPKSRACHPSLARVLQAQLELCFDPLLPHCKEFNIGVFVAFSTDWPRDFGNLRLSDSVELASVDWKSG